MTQATDNTRRALVVIALIALLFPGALGASDATYRATLNSWSIRVGTDATSVALAARQRHPRLMTAKALTFNRDALRARRAVSGQKVSTRKLRISRASATRAFTLYARAGVEWAASGRLRIAGKRTAAIAAARSGAEDAAAGSRLLLAASTLAR